MKVTSEVLKHGGRQYIARWEDEHRFSFPSDIYDLERILRALGSHYFDAESVRFFKSRTLNYGPLYAVAKDGKRGYSHPVAFFFVESVRFGYVGAAREYRICRWTPENPRSIDRVFKGSLKACNRMFEKFTRGEVEAPKEEVA